MKASELIAARKLKPPPSLTPKQVAELRLILDHNDANTSPQRRVGALLVIEMLGSMGWRGRSRAALDYVCALHFKRKGFSKK